MEYYCYANYHNEIWVLPANPPRLHFVPQNTVGESLL